MRDGIHAEGIANECNNNFAQILNRKPVLRLSNVAIGAPDSRTMSAPLPTPLGTNIYRWRTHTIAVCNTPRMWNLCSTGGQWRARALARQGALKGRCAPTGVERESVQRYRGGVPPAGRLLEPRQPPVRHPRR